MGQAALSLNAEGRALRRGGTGERREAGGGRGAGPGRGAARTQLPKRRDWGSVIHRVEILLQNISARGNMPKDTRWAKLHIFPVSGVMREYNNNFYKPPNT